MQRHYRDVGFAVLGPILSAAELDGARAEASLLSAAALGRGGVRGVLQRSAYFRELTCRHLVPIAAEVLGAGATAVKATLFDKTPAANWKVPWHQDLTIAVRERREVPGFGPWSVKDGIPHVQPPVAVLQTILALRLHLDDTPAENGALRVVPGSHRLGRLDQPGIERVRRESAEVVCPVEAGGAMLMSPLLLHASSPARDPQNRRVLHVELTLGTLSGGLEWAA